MVHIDWNCYEIWCKKRRCRVLIPNNSKIKLKRYEFTDFVLMKPNSLKISNWKEIRKRIFRAKSRKWGYDFQCDFKDMHKKEKYEYRKETPKVMYRFDTVFFNAQSFEYPDLACSVEEFIAPELEKNFYEDIKSGNQLRGEEEYLWAYCLRDRNNGWHDFEIGIFFWDNDIYQQVENL